MIKDIENMMADINRHYKGEFDISSDFEFRMFNFEFAFRYCSKLISN